MYAPQSMLTVRRNFLAAARANCFANILSAFVFHRQELDVNARDDHQYPALYYAIVHKNQKMIALLSSHGADFNMRCNILGREMDLFSYAEQQRIVHLVPQHIIIARMELNGKRPHDFYAQEGPPSQRQRR